MLFGRAPMCRLARAAPAGRAHRLHRERQPCRRAAPSPCARRWLEELGAAEQARILTETNPARLLANEGPLPVDPVPEANEGMLARLRDLITGRP